MIWREVYEAFRKLPLPPARCEESGSVADGGQRNAPLPVADLELREQMTLFKSKLTMSHRKLYASARTEGHLRSDRVPVVADGVVLHQVKAGGDYAC